MMTKSKFHPNYLLIYIIFLLLSRYLFLLFYINVISTIIFAIVHILMVIFIFYKMFVLRKLSVSKISLFFFVYLLILFAGCILIFNYSPGWEKNNTTITFILTLLLLAYCAETTFPIKIFNIYSFMIILVSVFFGLSILIPNNYNSNNELVLFTNNPNQCSLLYTSFFFGLFLTKVYAPENKYKKIFLNVLMLFMIVGTWLTKSRTSTITCLLSLLFYFLINKKMIKPKTILYSMFLFLILFPFIYITIGNLIDNDIQFLGKPLLSGRNILWKNIIYILFENPLSTHFTEWVPTTGFSYYGSGLNSHNTLLEIGWNYSMISMLFFLIVLFIFFKQIEKNCFKINNFASLAILSSIMFYMSFEASIFTGALDFTLCFILPVLIGVGVKTNLDKEVVL